MSVASKEQKQKKQDSYVRTVQKKMRRGVALVESIIAKKAARTKKH